MQKLSKKSMDFCQSTLLLISRGMERCGILFPLKFHFYNYSRLCYIYKHAVDMAKGKVLDVLCSATYLHKECILYIIVLQFPTCDIRIKAKEGVSEIGPTGGKSAEEIASGFKRTEIAQLLKNNVSRIGAQAPETFHPLSSGLEDYVLSLLKVTLAAYKTAFQPHQIESKTFNDLLLEVWQNVNSVPGRWKVARDKVAEAAYVVCEETCNNIKACKRKQEFYEAIINAYTIEENYLYDHLNTALRRQIT